MMVLLGPMLLIVLPRTAAFGQTGSCSITSTSAQLTETCNVGAGGALNGSFTAPTVIAGGAATSIAIEACLGAEPSVCGYASFTDLPANLSTAPPVTPRLSAWIVARRPAGPGAAAGQPTIRLRPTEARPGTLVTVVGSGFTPTASPSPTVTTAPPTTPPPGGSQSTTAPPTTAPPTTASASPSASATGHAVVVSHHSSLGPGAGLLVLVVLVILAGVVYLLWRRRRRSPPPGPGPPGPGHPGIADSQVYARLDDTQPQPRLRNRPGRPGRTMRIELHQQPSPPRIEKGVRDDDGTSGPAVRITRIPVQRD